MATFKTYTDIEQSKKLEKFLSTKSADMWYSYYGNSKYNPTIAYDGQQWFLCQIRNGLSDIPCWSLTSLLSVTRNYCNRFELTLRTNKKYNLFAMGDNFVYRGFDEYPDGIDNPIDACYEMILKLHELKML